MIRTASVTTNYVASCWPMIWMPLIPDFLGEGGFIMYRTGRRLEGLKESHRKVSRTAGGLVEEWLDIDDFNRLYNSLVFTVKADLFIPAGGRPETIDGQNWRSFLDENGVPSSAGDRGRGQLLHHPGGPGSAAEERRGADA